MELKVENESPFRISLIRSNWTIMELKENKTWQATEQYNVLIEP